MPEKQWCCSEQGLGCEGLFPPYSCRDDLHRRQEAWTAGKKDWCCLHENLGCASRDHREVYIGEYEQLGRSSRLFVALPCAVALFVAGAAAALWLARCGSRRSDKRGRWSFSRAYRRLPAEEASMARPDAGDGSCLEASDCEGDGPLA